MFKHGQQSTIEADLHKFGDLFLNPIEHCLSIYIGIIVCWNFIK